MTVSNKCSVCQHNEINAINEKLVSGVSPRNLAKDYGLNHMALYRHKDNHLPKTLVKAKQVEEQTAADDLLDRVETIYNQAWQLMEKAEHEGKYQPAVSALKEARNSLELIGKLIGQLKTGTEINITYNTEFIAVRGAIYKALLPYPEARQAVIQALDNELEDDQELLPEVVNGAYSERD